MTEREKIVEIVLNAEITGIALKDVIGGETTAKKLADALIENGIGDISEWKEKYARLEKSDTSKEDCTIEQHNEIHYLRDKLKQTQKECAEWKARAEVAERNDKIKERAVDFCFGCYCQLWCEECDFARECKAMTFTSYREQSEFCKNNHLQQAEKEIEEEQYNEQD